MQETKQRKNRRTKRRIDKAPCQRTELFLIVLLRRKFRITRSLSWGQLTGRNSGKEQFHHWRAKKTQPANRAYLKCHITEE